MLSRPHRTRRLNKANLLAVRSDASGMVFYWVMARLMKRPEAIAAAIDG